MAGGAPLPVREYASPAEMLARYADIRRTMLADRTIEPKPPAFQPQTPQIPAPDRQTTLNAAIAARTRLLADSRKQRLDRLKILQVARIVAAVSGVSVAEIKGERRLSPHVKARQITMYMAVRTGRTPPAVGYYLGGRDHTTVLHARKTLVPLARHLNLDRCHDAVEIAQRLWNADWALDDEAAR